MVCSFSVDVVHSRLVSHDLERKGTGDKPLGRRHVITYRSDEKERVKVSWHQ